MASSHQFLQGLPQLWKAAWLRSHPSCSCRDNPTIHIWWLRPSNSGAFWCKAGPLDGKYSVQDFPRVWLRPLQPLPLPNPASFPSWVLVSDEHLRLHVGICFQTTQPATKAFCSFKYPKVFIRWQWAEANSGVGVGGGGNHACKLCMFVGFLFYICAIYLKYSNSENSFIFTKYVQNILSWATCWGPQGLWLAIV